MSLKKRFFTLISAFFLIFSEASFAETAAPYRDDEFPLLLKDLRRAEIITLGTMPFAVLNVTLGYSFGKYAAHGFDSNYFVNPFAKTSSENSFSTDEQITIILTSVGISIGVGITDYIVHIVKRNSQKKEKKVISQPVIINPIAEDSSAVKLEPPKIEANKNSENENETLETDKSDEQQDYTNSAEKEKTVRSSKQLEVR